MKAAVPIIATSLLASMTPVNAAETLTEALTEGKASLNIRVRQESVSQNNPLDDADALTIRTRLGYKTGDFNGLHGYVEFEDTRDILEVDNYSVPPAGVRTGEYSVIADPEGSEVNQAFLAYQIDNNLLKWGNQRIIFDNARFVGNVGWRQNEQTYEGYLYQNKFTEGFAATAAYVTRVNSIFYNGFDHTTYFLNTSYLKNPAFQPKAYYYAIEDEDRPLASVDIYGAGAQGKIDWFNYKAEYAFQRDGNNNPANYDADYYTAELGATIPNLFNITLSFESLGADDDALRKDQSRSSFQTPLGTNHAFNGWADLFLTTPREGLEDTFVTVGRKVGPVVLKAIYHWFTADENFSNGEMSSGDEYGQEIDLLAVWKISNNYTTAFKYANFQADGDIDGSSLNITDTEKFWLWFEAKY